MVLNATGIPVPVVAAGGPVFSELGTPSSKELVETTGSAEATEESEGAADAEDAVG